MKPFNCTFIVLTLIIAIVSLGISDSSAAPYLCKDIHQTSLSTAENNLDSHLLLKRRSLTPSYHLGSIRKPNNKPSNNHPNKPHLHSRGFFGAIARGLKAAAKATISGLKSAGKAIGSKASHWASKTPGLMLKGAKDAAPAAVLTVGGIAGKRVVSGIEKEKEVRKTGHKG